LHLHGIIPERTPEKGYVIPGRYVVDNPSHIVNRLAYALNENGQGYIHTGI